MVERVFHLKPSRFFQIFLLISGLSVAMLIVNLDIAASLKMGIFSLFLSFYRYLFWCDGLLRGARAIQSIRRLNESSYWEIQTHQDTFVAELCGESIRTHLVMVLRFRVPERFLPIICMIWPDNLPNDQFRELSVLVAASGLR